MKTTAIRQALKMLDGVCGVDEAWAEVDAASDVDPPDPDPQTLVTEFHTSMGLPVASSPTVGTPEQRILRFRLMMEEVFEWGKAAGVRVAVVGWDMRVKGVDQFSVTAPYAPDLVQMTHELGDVQYVVSGTAVELGLPVREALPIIHEANMRKESVLDSGGKVRKPDGWVPADVSGLVNK